ncbi:MAG: hypothetical protein OEV42_04960 [Deltaproteobacteria bacterium]|nr:hypothetical protein [Deltaproteobacteria bacterium]
MDLIFTDDEKELFRKLQRLNNFFTNKSFNPHQIEKLLIMHIIINRFARLNIDPTLGQFDAFVDEIEAYLDKSTNTFAAFLREGNTKVENGKKK